MSKQSRVLEVLLITHFGMVGIYLTLLSGYTFIKRISDPSSTLIFSDRLSMLTAIQQECVLEGSGGWTFPVTCLNVFLRNIIFPIPFLVYFSTSNSMGLLVMRNSHISNLLNLDKYHRILMRFLTHQHLFQTMSKHLNYLLTPMLFHYIFQLQQLLH